MLPALDLKSVSLLKRKRWLIICRPVELMFPPTSGQVAHIPSIEESRKVGGVIKVQYCSERGGKKQQGGRNTETRDKKVAG